MVEEIVKTYRAAYDEMNQAGGSLPCAACVAATRRVAASTRHVADDLCDAAHAPSDRGFVTTFDVTPAGKYLVFDRTRQNSDILRIDERRVNGLMMIIAILPAE